MENNLEPKTTLLLTPRRWVFPLLITAMVLAVLLSLALGSVTIPLDNVMRVLTGGNAERGSWATIILQFRLPKALAALLAGSALAVSGLQMQTLFRNPLADPYILGISSGASLGVALVVLSVGVSGSILTGNLGLMGDFGLAAAASSGSALVMALVLLVARRTQSTLTLLILGLMFGYMTGAVVSMLIYFSTPERAQVYLAWSFGSFGGVTWNQMRVMTPTILLGLILSIAQIKALNAFLLGHAYARSMGLNIRRARVGIIVSASLLAGTVTAFCGPIAFLGISIPHLCRGLFNSSDHRILVPGSAILGATVALLADLVAHISGQQVVLPLNAVTSLIGAPVVIWVLMRQRKFKVVV
jgi:iron complex transport system permease protein